MERPEFVPQYLEDETTILERLLGNIPDKWRKENGDFPYDMVIPDVAQVLELQIAQDRI